MKQLKKFLPALSFCLVVGWCGTISAQELPNQPQQEQYYLISITEMENLQTQLKILKITNNKLQQESNKQKIQIQNYQQELQKMKKHCESLNIQLQQVKTYSQLNEKQLNDANKSLKQYKAEVESTIIQMDKKQNSLTKQNNVLKGIGLTLLTGLIVQSSHKTRR